MESIYNQTDRKAQGGVGKGLRKMKQKWTEHVENRLKWKIIVKKVKTIRVVVLKEKKKKNKRKLKKKKK
jgi:hypothetical protein